MVEGNPPLAAGSGHRGSGAAAASPGEANEDGTGLRSLAAMSGEALRSEWCHLYRVPPPPRVRRELLLLGVAWKRQELAQGGLGAMVQRRLAGLAGSLDEKGDVGRSRGVRLKPGARLIRAWRGETHSVLVLEDGFAWRGQRWRSLSEIAGAITGAHWSGPRFFGLKVEKTKKEAAGDA